MKKNWSVLAICQEPESREKAVKFCDELVRRFWDRYEITVSWVSFDLLLEKRNQIAPAPHDANLIVFAVAEEPIPAQVFQALESCLSARQGREGFFAGITSSQNSRSELALRNLAHRAHMDFVSEVPPNLEGALPDSPENCTSRAHEVSHVLSDILSRPRSSAPPLL